MEISLRIDIVFWGRYNQDNTYKGGCVLKFIKQMCLVILFSFLGELCRYLIPYPIPSSIYGMVLLVAALFLKVINPEDVRDVGSFLTSILPILFVPPLVNLMDCWAQLKENLIPFLVIVVVSTIAVFAVSGMVTQLLMKRRNKKGGADHA